MAFNLLEDSLSRRANCAKAGAFSAAWMAVSAWGSRLKVFKVRGVGELVPTFKEEIVCM